MSRIRALFLLLLSVAAWAADGAATGGWQRRVSYPSEALLAIGAVPVQEGGRIMPFDTYARVLLYRLHGMRVIHARGPIKERLGPTAWALDVLRYPEQADQYRLFRVEDQHVLEQFGLRLSEEELYERNHSGLVFVEYALLERGGALGELMHQAQAAANQPAKQRSQMSSRILALADNVVAYRRLRDLGLHLSLRADLRPAGIGDGRLSLAGLIEAQPRIRDAARIVLAQHDAGTVAASAAIQQGRLLAGVIQDLGRIRDESSGLHLFPPSNSDDTAWLDLSTLLGRALDGAASDAAKLRLLRAWESVADADLEVLGPAANALAAEANTQARQRGEGGKLASEVAYHRADLVYWSLVLYILGFVVSCAALLAPGRATLRWSACAAVLVPIVVLGIAIAWRCWLRGRPPVSTLYETILFVGWGATLFGLVAELITRRGLATVMTALGGVIAMFLAYRYEVSDGSDTMPQLVAVLDTNFWLATHVTTIVLGYAAGLLAGLVAHVYLIGRLIDAIARRPLVDVDFLRISHRIIYGVTCFGVLLSVVGTILGGIWANDSWGRFWGWDPKENGALMICLAQLLMLHARVGGLIREGGFAVLAVLTNTVIAFSWWHVNLLGVGLHSYGFTDGIAGNLWIFYSIQWSVAALGLLAVLASPRPARPIAAG